MSLSWTSLSHLSPPGDGGAHYHSYSSSAVSIRKQSAQTTSSEYRVQSAHSILRILHLLLLKRRRESCVDGWMVVVLVHCVCPRICLVGWGNVNSAPSPTHLLYHPSIQHLPNILPFCVNAFFHPPFIRELIAVVVSFNTNCTPSSVWRGRTYKSRLLT